MSPDYADPTLVAYRFYADRAIESWSQSRKPSQFICRFAARLPRGAFILDYGCGIGKDMAYLTHRRFRVEGVDGTLNFVEEARKRCPQASIRHARFDQVILPEARYDGIWANATLMHLPPQGLPQELEKLHRALKPGGVLGLTLSWGKRKGLIHSDWIPGRYMANYSKAEALRFFRKYQMNYLRVACNDGRKGRWIQAILL